MGLGLVAAFLLTRLAFLDRDLPPWDLAMYQPIDEIAYVIPAFNLHHYGTWTHVEMAGAPVEGSPVTVLQSLLVAGTLTLSWSYWGLRLSSVLLGLVAFGAMLAAVRLIARRAESDDPPPLFGALAITGAAAALLLVDFSFLLGGRVVEPTTARVAYVAVLLWLVARGTFLGPGHTPARSVALGIAAGVGVLFVYIYNLFLIPGILLALGVWAWRTRSASEAVRHVVLAAAGVAIGAAAYFLFILVVYGEGPMGWYSHWLGYFRDTGRATGFDPSMLWTILEGNVLRLDRPLMVITLLVAPAYAWWTWRTRDPLGIVVLSLLAGFAAQSTIQSDYPERKMLILLPLLLPMTVGGLARFGAFRSWVVANRGRVIGMVAWTTLVALSTVVLAFPSTFSRSLMKVLGLPSADAIAYRVGLPGTIVSIGALVGVAAGIALLLTWRRPAVARIAGLTVLVAAIGPLLNLDRVFVYANATTTFRDAMIGIRPLVDGRVTAGDWSFAMQLYNSSRPVLGGYVFGMSRTEYEAVVVRAFAEGRATSLFGYADEKAKAHLESLGFRLVETYPIILPKDRVMGRYVYG